MRKSLLVLSAAAIALSGMAATPKQKLHASGPVNLNKNVELKTNLPIRLDRSSSLKKAPAKLGSAADVITEVEGKKEQVKISSSAGYSVFYLWITQYENVEYSSNVVYGENDEVYIYNIVPDLITNSYVKGVKKDNKVVVELPQTVMFEEDYGFGLNANICVLPEDSEDGEYVPAENATLTFTVEEDGSMVADDLSEERILTVTFTDDDSWYYYSAFDLKIEPFNEAPVTAPDDFEVSENFWSYVNEDQGYGWPVSWLQGYDEVYFKGLSPEMPESLVKGTVEYGDDEAIITIEQNQYVGICYDYYYIFTKCAKTLIDEDGYEYYELMPDDYKYQMVWNYEDNTIKPKDTEVTLLLNASSNSVLALQEYSDYVLQHQESFEGIPQNPMNLEFEDYTVDYGECDFYFDVPGFSTEGDVLLTENLSYVVYVDGEEWEFDADEYYLEESMVEIPWSFDSDCIANYGGTLRMVVFFVEGISTVGVQTIYNYNGEETRSEIVTLDLEADPDAVGTVNAGKKVSSVKYYGLDGREVANPAAGIFVKRVIFEDGTVATFKKAVR